ncbi:prepilin-type N-terminal cleavage/methylation domain-containing protein [Psychrobacter sp. H8-1]|uniref:prepilin-type N-terminal cleavage/methylation domain-containing protein n=1 Tax=Psychrobacter sp. H8-1 TaxID=2774129 RepID=UPI00191A9973|nr:prepilin-type N-terminal cleavage/methylation domain-containing protein [Psychrobacter sp. H8-1]
MRQQRGFTLLELMVAMSIFAMLAVAGWQVFDSVNRARERAQFHADNLAALQYAYLQLQQDMGQIIAYQAPPTQNIRVDTASAPDLNNTNENANNNSENNNNVNSNSGNNQVNPIAAEPFMSLDAERVSFVRYADPDPRYQTSLSIQRVDYIFADQRLIRRQYNSVEEGAESISLDTVLVDEVTAGRWQAYLPEVSAKFPNANSQQGNNGNNPMNASQGSSESNKAQPMLPKLLPKGVGVSFTYQDMPITWQWALAPQAIPRNGGGHAAKTANNNVNNTESNSDNKLKNNLENNSENTPTDQ